MCGIAGIVDVEGGFISPAHLVDMNEVLAHRGPDDEGYVLIDGMHSSYRNYSGPASPREIRERFPGLPGNDMATRANIGLSQRRFSIIDLSASGHQPFFDEEGACCIVFNGEIYNYLEIREELIAHGITFSTGSDTEVLIKAYRHWGTDCFAKMIGFWAFALYDFKKRHLVLSRDRLGKRPLYWTRCGSQIYFASEIKALLRIPAVRNRRSVNAVAAYHWLSCGRKDLEFSTCFEGIYSLPSACWAIVNEEFPNNARTFWSVPDVRLSEKDISIPEAVRMLRELLEDAVRIRLRADVPLSIELSGGLDSSALVALAAAARSDKITTYTVQFPEKEYNEEPYARSVGKRFNTDYRVLESPTANFWSQIRAFTYLEEEPYHSPNLQTNQVIWAQMRSRGTKVSLNGAGGDENFAGYSTYYIPAQVENLMNRRYWRFLVNAAKYSHGRTNIRGLLHPLAAYALTSFQRFAPESWFPGETAPSYFKGKSAVDSIPRCPTLSQRLHSDMTNTLMPYWLRSGDRGYMGIPLEVRAPFLDHRVVEFAFRLPTTYLFRDGWHKWILRKALEDVLPADVVWRRRKMGFPFPFKRFYSENREILAIIFKNCSNPFVEVAKTSNSQHDWNLISFLLWYEMFFSGNVALFDKIEAAAREMNPEGDYGYAPQFLTTRGFAV